MKTGSMLERQDSTGGSLFFLLRMTGRELRIGLSGFYVFMACLALGVFVISGVGFLSESLRFGFERQGKLILGGDVTLSRYHTRANSFERELLNSYGTVSETATLRSMGHRLDEKDQTLVELKAIDSSYPLVGTLKVQNPEPPLRLLENGIIVDPILLERLNVKVGDVLRLGEGKFTIVAALVTEPDGLADRVAYGPRVFLSLTQLEKTGLLQPGALIRWRYGILLNDKDGSLDSPEAFNRWIQGLREDLKKGLPQSGFVILDRRDPSPQVTRTLERLRQFLTLLGLTALLTGGVGVANAVSAYIERQRKVIAIYKSLGASNRLIFSLFLSFVLVIALIGICSGVLFGFFVPPAVAYLGSGFLPLVPEFHFSFLNILRPMLFGILVALLFALWPLGHAAKVSARVLFREDIDPTRKLPGRGILVLICVTGAMLLLLTLLTSGSRWMVVTFVASLSVALFLFWFIAEIIRKMAQRFKRPPVPEIALALANLAAPGGLIRSVVLSLGLGLTVLVTVALVDSSFEEELKSRLPEVSPNYFVIDLLRRDEENFVREVRGIAPGVKIEVAPMLRGRIVSLKDTPVEDIKPPPDAEWVLTGDRGLTYSDTIPAGSKVVKGDWWKPEYSGDPLVSFEANLARSLNLDLGDKIAVNVLGRNITARVSSLRDVKWESLALNFVMIFSPNTFAGAPHNLLATVTLPKEAALPEEVHLSRVLAQKFSTLTTIRVKDAIEAFNKVFLKVMLAVRVAGSLTIVAGALVLAGAIATAHRQRIEEAIILKTLGATRLRICVAHALEYCLLALVTAFLALIIGLGVAYAIVTHYMEFTFSFSWTAVGFCFVLALILVLSFGFLGTWRVLGARPMPYLQSQ